MSARIRIHEQNGAFVRIRDTMPAAFALHMSDAQLDSSVRVHEAGDGGGLALTENCYLPNTLIEPHAHSDDEIIYVVDGELVLGARVLGAGASLYVAGGTLYGFSAGAVGARILVFRPAKGDYISKQSYLEARARARRSD